MTDEGPDRLAEPLVGRCLCGSVAITLHGTEKEVDICHCDMCQRWGGTFYAGLVGENVSIDGEECISVYKSSNWAERAFCSKCGSNLWYCFTPTGSRSFLAGLFNVPEGFGIKHQIFVDEKPDWYDLKQECPMKTGPEIIAEAEAMGFTFD